MTAGRICLDCGNGAHWADDTPSGWGASMAQVGAKRPSGWGWACDWLRSGDVRSLFSLGLVRWTRDKRAGELGQGSACGV